MARVSTGNPMLKTLRTIRTVSRRLKLVIQLIFWSTALGGALYLMICNYLAASTRSPISRVSNDMRSMGTALETYMLDHSRFPISWPMRALTRDISKLSEANGLKVGAPFGGNSVTAGLTTPVSYLTLLFPDPFAPNGTGKVEGALPFGYYSDPKGERWILISPGQDRGYEIVAEEDFDSSITEPSRNLLLKSYDPTNGATSAGDLWRTNRGNHSNMNLKR